MSIKRIVSSWVSPKITIKNSKIHKLGMFAAADIEEGEIVFIKGGHILTRNELYCSETISSYLPLDDNHFIGATNEEEEKSVRLFNNHSCDPNCGLRGEITFVAMRKILEGEELTCDYAMIDNEEYEFECTCGSNSCRKIITGFDWKIEELQKKYAGYFARYLEEKIKNRNEMEKRGSNGIP
jgi:SET domain-containing protein